MSGTSEILAHARRSARAEAERLEVQAAIERIHREEITRAQTRIDNHGRGWRIAKGVMFWVLLLGSSVVSAGIPLVAYLIYRHLKKAWATP